MGRRIIPILPDRAAYPTEAPRLVGDQAELQRVLAALQAAIGADFGAPLPCGAWLRELRLEHDEAELALAPGIGSKAVDFAQTAFDTLRQLLPDTDIYVRPGRG